MSANGMDSSTTVGTSYQMQQVEAYCDNSWPTLLVGGVKQLSPMPFLYNLPYSIITTPWSWACSVLSGIAAIPSIPGNIYHYFTREPTDKESACNLVMEVGTEAFDKADAIGRNALGQHIANNSIEAAEVFAVAGIDPNQRDLVYFSNILHQLSATEEEKLLEIILQQSGRADVNAIDKNGMTPLHIAALSKQAKILKSLLTAGAKPNIVDVRGRTAILLAAKYCSACFKELLDLGIPLKNSWDDRGAGLWHYAASNPSSTEVMAALKAHNIPVHQVDIKGQTPMHYAAFLGNAQAVDNLVYHGLGGSRRDRSGVLPIHAAAMEGYTNVIHRLAAYKFNVDALAPGAETALMIAAKLGHADAVGALIYNYADVNLENRNKETALNLAALSNNPEVVRKLLAAGAKVNHIPASGHSARYDALKRGFDEVADLLAENGGIVQGNEDGSTRLNEAVALNDYSKVQELLLKGYSLNCRDYDYQTPLMVACIRKNPLMAQSLISAGVSEKDKGMLVVRDSMDRQAIHFAAQISDTSILKKLLDNGASHLAVDKNGRLPIHYAAEVNNVEALRILAPCNYPSLMGIDVQDCRGLSPLLLAALNGHVEAAAVLLKHKATPASVNEKGRSPLHMAAINGDQSFTELLLKTSTAGINWTDNDGHTPLYYAAKGKHNALADTLMKSGATIYSEAFDELQLAVLKGDVGQVSDMLNANFPMIGTIEDQTALHLGLRVGNTEINEKLMSQESKALTEYKDAEDNTPLLLAAMYNRTSEAISLINTHKANIEARNTAGETALHLASKNGNNELVFALALRGADLESSLPNGLTPYGLAVSQDHQETCKLLADLGADQGLLVKRNVDPSYAFLNIIYSGDFQAVQEFLLLGANTEVRTEEGWTALHCAVVPSVPNNILQSLLDAGLDMNAVSKTKKTPLLLAATFQNIDAVSTLLEKSKEIEKAQLDKLLGIAKRTENTRLIDLVESKLAK